MFLNLLNFFLLMCYPAVIAVRTKRLMKLNVLKAETLYIIIYNLLLCAQEKLRALFFPIGVSTFTLTATSGAESASLMIRFSISIAVWDC